MKEKNFHYHYMPLVQSQRGMKVTMNVNINKLIALNELLTLSSRRKHKIVLNPYEDYGNEEKIDEENSDVVLDKTEWKIPDKIHMVVDALIKNNQLSNEDKILAIFDELCKTYIYDDNVLSYIQKVDGEDYDLPDWYGREIDPDWQKNREKHNRRVCYEVSRYLAQALGELFEDNNEFASCIFWDKGRTHYFVGLAGDDYKLTLDLDDFDNIKDLTRIKTGLTIEGINILDDQEGKFKRALDHFNENRNKYAIKKIEDEIEEEDPNENKDEAKIVSLKKSDDIIFLENALEILTKKFNIDSQGLFEYIKEIVDIKIGPEARKKVWKKLEGKYSEETRYIRCLVLELENQTYIVDVDEKILRPFNEKELFDKNTNFIPFKKFSRDWGEYYDGT